MDEKEFQAAFMFGYRAAVIGVQVVGQKFSGEAGRAVYSKKKWMSKGCFDAAAALESIADSRCKDATALFVDAQNIGDGE